MENKFDAVAIRVPVISGSIVDFTFVAEHKTSVEQVNEIMRKATKEKRSIVETGTMTLFFVGFYLLIRFQIGTIQIPHNLQYILILSGLTMVVAGCTINIVGRLNLGKNWANQIRIYQNQIAPIHL